jgi:uncharacterized protein
MGKAREHFADHRKGYESFIADLTLLMIGPFTDPARGAMGVFSTREAAEEFVKQDPFVLRGVVATFEILEWNEVLVQPG